MRQLGQFKAAFPESRLHRFEPVGAANRREAMRLAFGRVVDLHYRQWPVGAGAATPHDTIG